jgi:hypothetical protein
MSPDETTRYLDAIDDAREAMRHYKLKRILALYATIAAGIWIVTIAVLGVLSVLFGWFGRVDIGGSVAGLEVLGMAGLAGGVGALGTVTGGKRYDRLRKAIRSAEREFQRKAL